MTLFKPYRYVVTVSALLLLGGCGGLLGNSGKRDTLFRFGVAEQNNTTAAERLATGRPLTLARIRFAPEIEGDRILTTRGASVLYVKDARWVASAPELFAQAMTRQFDQRAANIRLVSWRTGGAGAVALQLNLDRFEARYATGSDEKSPPTILISGDATLTALADRGMQGSRRFVEEEPARQNSKAEIAAAFDRATARFTAAVVDWTSETLTD
ncbi:cholesterol transport system auxiliary component [Sphingomonas laterariae]|uniref:Cholesterol transport system auxiliary component n=1 Tax=Edaphosphingomonas laterariae TaxID=861865 RepID=A0A239K341_9SPHN|nr:ABC-type transport auxiliary lipoprotein family protein [Sphingomonas laterariae]SNT12420.1 cholesterol transport system auxiliary component [Sphingomonas laterariae]